MLDDQQQQQQQQPPTESNNSTDCGMTASISQHSTSSNSMSKSGPNLAESSVRFDEISFREYNMIPCENPTCSSGVPIG